MSRLPSVKDQIKQAGKFAGRWKGQTVACIASGPSLTPQDCERVRAAGLPTIVTNTTFRLCPWADVLYAMDKQWWLHYLREVEKTFTGDRVTVHLMPHRLGVIPMKNCGFNSYSHSGAGAISLAIHGGAARVLLLGYDCQHTGGRAHWHGDHGGLLGNARAIDRWMASYDALRARMDKAGVEYLNCTRETALGWPRADLDQVLA
ncbi:MAG: hypothetical protein KBG29_08490 [Pseudomonadales bacterium]|nr:hypothetical protein [Pseudomonadales bacterium]